MAATARPAARKTTAARPPQDRKPRARKTAPSVTDFLDQDPDVIDLDNDEDALSEETVVLFRLTGTDYRVPKDPPASIGLKAIDMMKTEGEIAAGAWMLHALLGDGPYNALRDHEGLTKGQLTRITERAARIAMGPVEETNRPLGRG